MEPFELDFGPTEEDEHEAVYWNTLHQFCREVRRVGLDGVLNDLETIPLWLEFDSETL